MGDEDASSQLVTAALAGEPLALEKLLLHISPRLSSRIERRMPSELRTIHAPDDVLQDVLSELFVCFHQFVLPSHTDNPGEQFVRWVCTIADRRLIDLVRAQRATKRGGGRSPASGQEPGSLQALIELVAIHHRTPSRSASGREAESAIRQGISALPPDHRLVIELRYLKGLSPAQVAEQMGRSEHAVHNLCSRAVQSLREAMGDPARYLSQG